MRKSCIWDFKSSFARCAFLLGGGAADLSVDGAELVKHLVVLVAVLLHHPLHLPDAGVHSFAATEL